MRATSHMGMHSVWTRGSLCHHRSGDRVGDSHCHGRRARPNLGSQGRQPARPFARRRERVAAHALRASWCDARGCNVALGGAERRRPTVAASLDEDRRLLPGAQRATLEFAAHGGRRCRGRCTRLAPSRAVVSMGLDAIRTGSSADRASERRHRHVAEFGECSGLPRYRGAARDSIQRDSAWVWSGHALLGNAAVAARPWRRTMATRQSPAPSPVRALQVLSWRVLFSALPGVRNSGGELRPARITARLELRGDRKP